MEKQNNSNNLNIEKLQTASESVKSHEVFNDYCDALARDILKEVAKRYDNNLDFHNSHHTENVVDLASKIAKIMNRHGAVSKREVDLVKIASAAHDLVQNEGSGVNEEKSADELCDIMDKTDIFSELDKNRVREAIMATIAEPAKDKDGFSTIIQKNLTPDSSPMALTLALADLGTAGRNAEEFLSEGDKLYKEFHLEGKVAKKDWDKMQVEIAVSLKNAFEEKISALSEEIKAELRRLFGSFDESILKAKARVG